MVDSDIRDDCNVRIDQIHCIEPPSEADFKNKNVQMRIGKEFEGNQRREFEKGQRNIAPDFLDHFKVMYERFIVDHLAVDFHTLVEKMDMGRGIQTGLVTRFAVNRLEHGRGRPFAVRPAHRDDRTIEPDAQPFFHDTNPLQPHFDIPGVQAFHNLNPFRKGTMVSLGFIHG